MPGFRSPSGRWRSATRGVDLRPELWSGTGTSRGRPVRPAAGLGSAGYSTVFCRWRWASRPPRFGFARPDGRLRPDGSIVGGCRGRPAHAARRGSRSQADLDTSRRWPAHDGWPRGGSASAQLRSSGISGKPGSDPSSFAFSLLPYTKRRTMTRGRACRLEQSVGGWTCRLFLGAHELVAFQGGGDIVGGLVGVGPVSAQHLANTTQTDLLLGPPTERYDIFYGRPDVRFLHRRE